MEIPADEDLHEDPFRCVAAPEINELYAAAAAAAAARQMPALREMCLVTYDVAPGSGFHGFLYRYNDSTGGSGGGTTIAHWGSSPAFKPEEMVVDLWEKVSREVRGCELEAVVDEDQV